MRSENQLEKLMKLPLLFSLFILNAFFLVSSPTFAQTFSAARAASVQVNVAASDVPAAMFDIHKECDSTLSEAKDKKLEVSTRAEKAKAAVRCYEQGKSTAVSSAKNAPIFEQAKLSTDAPLLISP